jgi:hypothetical protein
MLEILARGHGAAPKHRYAPVADVLESRCLLATAINGLVGMEIAPRGVSIPASGYQAYTRIPGTVDWGDGSGPKDVEVYLAGWSGEPTLELDLSGYGHVYTSPGTYTIHLDYGAPGGTPGSAEWVATIEHFALTGVTQEVEVGTDVSGATLAYVETYGQDFDPADFTATIDWHDGSPPTTATITRQSIPGPDLGDIPRTILAVTGSHAYSAAGFFQFTATMTDSEGETHTWHGGIVISETITPPPAPVPASTGIQGEMGFIRFGRILREPWMTPDEGWFSATIAWGDGSVTENVQVRFFQPNGTDGSVVEFGGAGLIHTYTQPGTYTVHAVIHGPGGETAEADTAAVIDHFRAYGLTLEFVAGQPLGGVTSPIGYLEMPGETPDPSAFTGTIDWGDGSAPEAATFAVYNLPTAPDYPSTRPARIGLSITNTHVYATPRIYSVSVTLTDTLGETHILRIFAFISGSAEAPGGSAQSNAAAAPPPAAQDTGAVTPTPAASMDKGAETPFARRAQSRALAALRGTFTGAASAKRVGTQVAKAGVVRTLSAAGRAGSINGARLAGRLRLDTETTSGSPKTSGTFTLGTAGRGRITLLVRSVARSGESDNPATAADYIYTITGGTKRFRGATGEGSLRIETSSPSSPGRLVVTFARPAEG